MTEASGMPHFESVDSYGTALVAECDVDTLPGGIDSKGVMSISIQGEHVYFHDRERALALAQWITDHAQWLTP
jgi:hypothetical protein